MRSAPPFRLFVLLIVLACGRAVAADLVMVLDSVPSGAQVEHAGRVIGRTPVRLNYPKGYFEPRGTVWGAYLGAPLEFTISAPGYEPKTVKLGNGPHPWRNLYGQIVYQYYLLDRSYRIELTPAGQGGSEEGDDLTLQLARLAELKEKGALTEAEFAAAKAAILAGGAPPQRVQANHLEREDPASLCSRLIDKSISSFSLAKAISADRQVSTAADGSDRAVRLVCAWQLVAPAATLTVSVECADKPKNIATLCGSSGQEAADSNPACVWGSDSSGSAVALPGCLLGGSVHLDSRRATPNSNPITLDVREVLRSMASRI